VALAVHDPVPDEVPEMTMHIPSRRVRAVLPAIAASLAVSLGIPARAAGTGAQLAVELSAPVELVWQVLTDFASWPRFMPGLRRVRVRDLGRERVAIDHETEKMGFDVRFTAITRVNRERLRLDLALDESQRHDLAAMRASWQVTRLPKGRVRVDFRSDVDSGQPVPGFLERRMIRRSAAETVAALAHEIERRKQGS
jgi:ribosome-associated toxin RatA of RatAB toxin-antitoxin module